jgi:hypothetical protein
MPLVDPRSIGSSGSTSCGGTQLPEDRGGLLLQMDPWTPIPTTDYTFIR